MQINAWHTKLNVNSVIPVIAVSGKMLTNESFIWNDMAGYTKRHYQSGRLIEAYNDKQRVKTFFSEQKIKRELITYTSYKF